MSFISVRKQKGTRQRGTYEVLAKYLVRGIGPKAVTVLCGNFDKYRYSIESIVRDAAAIAVSKGWRKIVVANGFVIEDICVSNIDSFLHQKWDFYPPNASFLKSELYESQDPRDPRFIDHDLALAANW